MEQWKDIPGYEGLYQVSNLGNIKALNYHREKREEILKQKINRGYCSVHLCKDGKAKFLMVSHCVYEAFNGQIPEGYEVNHIDENPLNNRLDNLNLLTHSENINWGNRNTKVGKKLGKRVFQYDLNGNYVSDYPSVAKAGEMLGRNFQQISACATGKQKTAYGFVWRYAV